MREAAVASSRLRSVSVPPCASATWRASTSPIPLPPGLVVKKGTNRLSGFATPGPLSFTSKTTLSLPRMARSSTGGAPAGVASIALRTRLMSACWIWSASPRSVSALGRRELHAAGWLHGGDLQKDGRGVAVRDRGLGHTRELAVARQEAPERLRALGDQRQVLRELLALRLRGRAGRERVAARLDHRLDRRQRVVELVPDHPDQTSPGTALLLPQRLAQIRDDQQPERPACPREIARASPASGPRVPGTRATRSRPAAPRAGRQGRAPSPTVPPAHAGSA